MFELEVKATFDAAHRVAGYPGKCDRMHGHTWEVSARAKGTQLNELGILMDFKAFSGALKETLSALDHQCLNELPMFSNENPTAENIAKHIYNELSKNGIFAAENVELSGVTVWESNHSSVTYNGEN